MTGIYIHIPYCKQACHYCDFHFSTQTRSAPDMIPALLKEIRLRQDYLKNQPVSTIYFGGGTPSLLSGEIVEDILHAIRHTFLLSEQLEVTLEANPDDLTYERLREFASAGINRLSIGIQSFDDKVLRYLNRAHTGSQARESIAVARDVGFRNISIDLIYAIPEASEGRWQRDLKEALEIFPEHISTYGLTIEPGTVFGHQLKSRQLSPVPEEQAAGEYEELMDKLIQAGYDHYEISNFALPGHRSRHNTSYWQGKSYLGIGPGAHSYNGVSRQHNIPNNGRYIDALRQEEIPAIREDLSELDKANEYLLTSLRTSWGIDTKFLASQFRLDLFAQQGEYISRLMEGGLIFEEESKIILTNKGKLLADQITEDLFLTKPLP